ncbi:MAG: sigma-54-dependent Fis family transcriptional regulator, partial [Nitrospirae bacterium]|nr:sigma-54-dependent Fis family transcriptional regulator [Nitrospirota bacterium]
LHLGRQGHEVFWVTTAAEGLERIQSIRPQVCILDIRLPDEDGLAVLSRIRSLAPHVNVVMITAFHDMETTVKAMQSGAMEYIQKPIDIQEIDRVMSRIAQTRALEAATGPMISMRQDYKENEIIGKSWAMKEIFKLIALVSQSRTTVLIQGESGTGKELIAKAVHLNSLERNHPFISVNCSAIVETLLESELFGHEKGAFTGAAFRKDGKFALAEGGTLFLDEIGDMTLNLQVKLLRVLQEKEFERVGGHEKIRVDVRVISATNRNLEEEVKKGNFREDLYYRLKVVTISVPPLRNRKEDIPPLVAHLLAKIDRDLHKQVTKIPQEVMKMLVDYPWMGNVRELENVLTRAIVLSGGEILLPEHLAIALPSRKVHEETTVEAAGGGSGPLFASLKEMEKGHVEYVLGMTGWHKGKACQILGISRPRLERKIRKYRLVPPEDRPSS